MLLHFEDDLGAGAMAKVQKKAMVVVGLDLGTEWSGFAYSHTSNPTKIFSFTDSPSGVKGEHRKQSLKMLSAIYYEPGDAAIAKVKSWGSAARSDYESDIDAMRVLRERSAVDVPEVGTYFEDFKDARKSSTAKLKKGFTVAKVIADYLREMGAFIMSTLQGYYGKDMMSMNTVQWCVTVPSDWGDHAEKLMEVSMERAGLVQSANSLGGSPHPMSVVRELEAASCHCLRKHPDLGIQVRDKLLVANIGNKASDIVVQKVVSVGKSSYEVKDVEKRFGDLPGGMQMDEQFNELMLAKIPCLQDCLQVFPWIREALQKEWEQRRCGFGDSRFYGESLEFCLPSAVAIRWNQFDIEHSNSPRDSYDKIELMYTEIEKAFEPVVYDIVRFIANQFLSTSNVKAILVVGERNDSPYLLAKIKERLSFLPTVVLKPVTAVTAASRGAVALALDQVTTASEGGVQLSEYGAASSSHGDGIALRSSSKAFSQLLSAHDSTVQSRNTSHGSSEPSPRCRQNDSRVEDVVKKYTWDQVLHMTNGLTSRRLGQGGFGTVYLGKFENGKEVAVKILNPSSQQSNMHETFVNEVNLLMRVNHVNLVKLLGYCQDEQKVLIYEFAEEGSIGDHLHGEKTRLKDWKQRLSIALQAACGLEYLHTQCNPTIIHRDIKCENILLTKNMFAKVADFGISRLMGAEEGDNNWRTHITTQVMGSRGYLDPEYSETGLLRHSSDVYSFGIVLLEMITGRKPVPNPNDPKSCIGNWVRRTYGSGGIGAVKAVADSGLGGRYNLKAMKSVIKLAMLCLNHSGERRPEMSGVVRVLRKAQSLEMEEKKSWFTFL